MSWDEVTVSTWHDFTAALEPFLSVYRVPPNYLFRGQPDAAWCLKPSLLRQLEGIRDPIAALGVEKTLEDEFKAQASLYRETERVWMMLMAAPRHELWAYMQHHGCPTRLLDWTASAFVAAYFVVEQHPDRHGALFVVQAAALDLDHRNRSPETVDITDDDLIDTSAPERVVFTWPWVRSPRVVAQQAHFSVNTNILGAHDGPIVEACSRIVAASRSGIIQSRIVIPPSLKPIILQQLRVMNIDPQFLFPTLDGLGRSLTDLARLKVAQAREAP